MAATGGQEVELASFFNRSGAGKVAKRVDEGVVSLQRKLDFVVEAVAVEAPCIESTFATGNAKIEIDHDVFIFEKQTATMRIKLRGDGIFIIGSHDFSV